MHFIFYIKRNKHAKGLNMTRHRFNRYCFYAAGVVLLSAGITLNTKTALGVSPLISLLYSIAEIWHLSFPLMTLVLYTFFVALQFILKGKNRQLKDILQIPLSIVFSALLDVFSKGYDALLSASGAGIDALLPRICLLVVAVAMTGIGASMMISMDLIPNPADGLAHTVGIVTGKGLGTGKNIIDFSSVAITCLVGLISCGRLVGVGIGTVVGMIGVGRCIAIFNLLFHHRMMTAIGRHRKPSALQEPA